MLLFTDNKRHMDNLMLLLCPGIVLLGVMIPEWTGTQDIIRYYAVYTLVVGLLLMYVPTHQFFSRQPNVSRFGLQKITLPEALCAVLLGVALFSLTTVMEQYLYAFYDMLGADMSLLGASAKVEGGWRLPALIVLGALIPAYVEEALFRGALLFSWLPFGQMRAVVHSALLFSLIHLNPLMLPVIFFFSLVLGLAATRSGSIWPSAILHGTNNLLAVVLLHMQSPVESPAAAAIQAAFTQNLHITGIVSALATALFFVAFLFAAKRGRSSRALKMLEGIVESVEAQAACGPMLQERLNAIKEEQTSQAAKGPMLHTMRKRPVLLTYVFMAGINAMILLLLFIVIPN